MFEQDLEVRVPKEGAPIMDAIGNLAELTTLVMHQLPKGSYLQSAAWWCTWQRLQNLQSLYLNVGGDPISDEGAIDTKKSKSTELQALHSVSGVLRLSTAESQETIN